MSEDREASLSNLNQMFDVLKKKKRVSRLAPNFNPKIIDLTKVEKYKRTLKDKRKTRLSFFRSFGCKIDKVMKHKLKVKKKPKRVDIKNLIKKWHNTVKNGCKLNRSYIWAGKPNRFTYTSQANHRTPHFPSTTKIPPFTANTKFRRKNLNFTKSPKTSDSCLNLLYESGNKKVGFFTANQNL